MVVVVGAPDTTSQPACKNNANALPYNTCANSQVQALARTIPSLVGILLTIIISQVQAYWNNASALPCNFIANTKPSQVQAD